MCVRLVTESVLQQQKKRLEPISLPSFQEFLSTRGVGGVLGGSYWSYLLDESERCLPIAVLEAAAWYGVVAAFAAVIPPDALVLGEVDALATVDTLTDDAASSPLMQHFSTTSCSASQLSSV